MGHDSESLSRRDYQRLCALIHEETGIHLGTEKQVMLESRVKRRLKALEIESYSEYCDFLFAKRNTRAEMVHLIDVVTTNKTDFFREPKHFDFLMERAVPALTARANGERPLLVWSAGCSSGEEPYTLAMLLSEYAQTHPGFRFRILATDISTTVLEKASMGVYTEEVIAPVPAALKRKYFLRSRDRTSRRVRVAPELRNLIEFRRLNFMDTDYGITEKADAIFCRNVIIYFNRATQESILRKLSHCLVPSGYLFVGHAESLHEMKLPITPVAPSLYQRVSDGT